MLPTLIIDFDSTFVTLESLDELARIALRHHPDRPQIMQELTRLTDLGMTGKIGFRESLQRRLKLFAASREQVAEVIALLKQSVTPSVEQNRDFLQQYAERIYVISGGFVDYIWPVVREFGVKEENVLANRFRFGADGTITGCDPSCLLSQDNGKVRQVAALRLARPIIMVGDGYTDYQVKAAGEATSFLAFVENIQRSDVVSQADQTVHTFDEVVAAFQPT